MTGPAALARNRSLIAGFAVFLLASALSGWMAWQLEKHALEGDRISADRYAGVHAHLIDHTIEHSLSAAHALAAQVKMGHGSVPDFDEAAGAMLPFYPSVSALALAPGGVIRKIAPLEGNEAAVGLDLLNLPAQSQEARLARDSGQLTLAGPLELVQGGTGVVGRLPVFLEDEAGRNTFWGFTGIVIRLPGGLNVEHLSELQERGLEYELWRFSPVSGKKQVIARSSAVELADPVKQTLSVPNASWTLSVAPAKGWMQPWRLYQKLGLALLVSLLLGYLVTLLFDLRRHKKRLELRVADRTADILMTQRKLRATLDAIPDLVWMKDANGVYLSCNPMFERFFGAREGDIVGKTDYDFVDREQADFFCEHDRKAMLAGKPSVNEECLTFADDGSKRWVETVKTPIFDEQGQAVGVLGIARDITERQQAERSLYASRQRLRLLLDSMAEGAYGVDIDGRCTFVNQTFLDMLGYEDVSEVLGRVSHELIHHSHADGRPYPKSECRMYRAMQAGQPISVSDEVFWRKDGTPLPVEYRARPIVVDGKVVGGISTFVDISERLRAETQLGLAAQVFEHSSEGILITDARLNIVMVNQAFTAISGYSEAETLGQTPSMLASGRHDKAFYDEIWRCLASEGRWQGEIWNRRKDGTVYPETLSIIRVLDGRGEVTHYIGVFQDITLQKETQDRIQRLAHYDPLTGLPNRALLADRIHIALSAAQRNHEPLALLFVDLDHFKNINDTLGHRVGDALLVEVASRLEGALREVDTVSRQGGDEFVLILPDTDARGAAHVAGKLLETVAQPCRIGDDELNITLSIGIALYPDDGADFETLSGRADAAMYRAKHDGRNAYCFFTTEMQAQLSRNLQLENALRRALERDQLQLHYQPQVSLQDGRLIGVEALMRWQHPELGMIPPTEFIPLAEENGQIVQIGEWALRQAVGQMKAWMDSGLVPIAVAVNLSVVQFRHPRLSELVGQILDQAQLPAGCLELELTESITMGDAPAAIAVMDRLHACGIRLSIDDFGTGYSSLSYLKRFKMHRLKIDQGFVRGVCDNPEDRAIVEAIISLAKSLGLMTIAEGVETEAQLDFLRAHGCDEIQGYLVSKPMPADQFIGFVQKRFPAAWLAG